MAAALRWSPRTRRVGMRIPSGLGVRGDVVLAARAPEHQVSVVGASDACAIGVVFRAWAPDAGKQTTCADRGGSIRERLCVATNQLLGRHQSASVRD